MKKLLLSFSLLLSVIMSAQIEVYFPQDRGIIDNIHSQKHIVTIQENDTVNCSHFATQKYTVYNASRQLQRINDNQHTLKTNYFYTYDRSVLNGIKTYSSTGKLLTISTVNYINNDSILEVVMTPMLKPLATKVIVKKDSIISSTLTAEKDGDIIEIHKNYHLNKRELIEKYIETKYRNNKLFSTTTETIKYTKFDIYDNYTEAIHTIDDFTYRTKRTISYRLVNPLPKTIPLEVIKKTRLSFDYRFSFGKPNHRNFHLLGVSLVRESDPTRHGSTTQKYIGVDASINAKKFVLAPKIGVRAMYFNTVLGLSLINYTDFSNNSLRIVPEIGLGGEKVQLSIKPHIILTNKNFRPVNNISAGLTYFFDL